MASTKEVTKKMKKSRAASPKTKALHARHKDGSRHVVGLWNLHVMLIQEGKFWVAQGLEIDYVVQGNSIEEAKSNFEKGLEDTIDLNLKMYKNIEGLLIFAPNEILQEAARNKKATARYSQVSAHDTGVKFQEALPFDGISYLVATQAA